MLAIGLIFWGIGAVFVKREPERASSQASAVT